jgi:CO/xanthine dehydrogenase Mo-binding subunit
VEVHSAAVDSGQGLATVLTQVVRTELGVRNTGPAALTLEDGHVLAGGVPLGPVEAFLEEPVIATRVYRHRPTVPLDEHGQGEIHPFFAFVAERAVVDVDTELGLVRVAQLAVVEDVGRAINPKGLEGQLEGGAAIGLGLGLALMEQLQLQDGSIRNPSFTDYLLPTILDVPPIVTELVEHPEPSSPYGAKGVGEIATIAATPALVNALRAATARALNRVPVRPDDLIGIAPPLRSDGQPPSPAVPGPRPILAYHGRGGGQVDCSHPNGHSPRRDGENANSHVRSYRKRTMKGRG